MSHTTDRDSDDRVQTGPKYLEIRRRLLKKVRSGAFAPDEALPKERDLAVSLNVAIGTVRHALRGLESDGLIRRVRGRGTFINSAEQRRARIRTNVFSLILPALREDPIYAVIEGVERAVAKAKHRLMISNSDNDPARQAELLREAAEANVAAVMLIPPTQVGLAEQVEPLRERQIPLVFCNRAIPGVAAPLVTWPHVEVGRMAADALLAQGHRRVVSLADIEDVFIDAVGVGIRQALREQGVDTANFRLFCHGERLRGDHARNAIQRALRELLLADDRPTAIQCFNSFDAGQVYLLAGELGFRVPEDLSLIYFGSQRREGALAQRLTCVGVDGYAIGVRACQLLDQMNAGLVPHESDQKIEIPLVLLPGETVGPPARDETEGKTV